MFPNIDSSLRGSKKQNSSGINLLPEFITLAISIKTNYDSHLLIKHAITPVNQRILKNGVILALMQSNNSPWKSGVRFHEFSAVHQSTSMRRQITSYQRRCGVTTSHRRRYDIVLTASACWQVFVRSLLEIDGHVNLLP